MPFPIFLPKFADPGKGRSRPRISSLHFPPEPPPDVEGRTDLVVQSVDVGECG